MSVVRCDRCSGQIDTDRDTESEVYVGNYKRLHATAHYCEQCRYQLECDREHFEAMQARAEYEFERREYEADMRADR